MPESQLPTLAGLRGLAGRVAVVTGAGGEIGGAICERLGLEGVRVLATDRTPELAEGIVHTLVSRGCEAVPLVVDVTQPDDHARIIPAAVGSFGEPPSIGVSCAGIQTFADIFTLPLQDWDRVFDVNAKGAFLFINGLAAALRAADRGAVVTVASLQGRLGSRYYAHYSASKAAVLSLTRSFAVALAPDRVRVNAVAPGIVDTFMWRAADENLARLRGVPSGQPRRERVAQVPLGRPGTPQDVAAAVAFLASEDASYITGECIHVCGGDLML